MSVEELKKRTKTFALKIIKLVESLPVGKTADVLGKQLLRCGTSVGANYRSACRAKSKQDFIAKMSIVEEEADESIYWMELLLDIGLCSNVQVSSLLKEANELVAITVASIKTARDNLKSAKAGGIHHSTFRTPNSAFKGGVTQAAKGDRL